MSERLIFHCDCNNFFASCECLERPELKNVPMAVAGDPEERVGIVVAKNELAKKYGVKTTDMTFRRDLHTRDEIETGVAVQVDRIAMSLRRKDLKGSVVSVQIKTPQLITISRQTSLNHYTWLEHEIREVAMRLIDENWHMGDPIRAITVGVSKLVPSAEATEQLDLSEKTAVWRDKP